MQNKKIDHVSSYYAATINEAINCNKPSIIEIPVDPEELGTDVKL